MLDIGSEDETFKLRGYVTEQEVHCIMKNLKNFMEKKNASPGNRTRTPTLAR